MSPGKLPGITRGIITDPHILQMRVLRLTSVILDLPTSKRSTPAKTPSQSVQPPSSPREPEAASCLADSPGHPAGHPEPLGRSMLRSYVCITCKIWLCWWDPGTGPLGVPQAQVCWKPALHKGCQGGQDPQTHPHTPSDPPPQPSTISTQRGCSDLSLVTHAGPHPNLHPLRRWVSIQAAG